MNEKIVNYLNVFKNQREAGLIVVEKTEHFEEIKNQINRQGFQVTNLWQETIEQLRNGNSICLELSSSISKELYDLIAQYSARNGAIQIMDNTTMKLKSIQFNPAECHLLLLALKQNLQEIEKTHSLKEKVGLVERI